MSKPAALHTHLVAPVKSCFTCPLAFLKEVSPFGGDHLWGCSGEGLRDIGAERSEDGSPEWCPLKRQPIVVLWVGEGGPVGAEIARKRVRR